MIRNYFLLLALLIFASLNGQNFNGVITYKIELLNPEDSFNKSKWKSQLEYLYGEKGYMTQSFYYNNDKYFSETTIRENKSYHLYDSMKKLLYSWFDNSETASKIEVQRFKDQVIRVENLENNETINGINCDIIVLSFESGKKMKLWYNDKYFKITNSLFAGHRFNNFEQITDQIRCLPIKIEEKSKESWAVQTMLSYEEKEVDKKKFILPYFEKVVYDNEGW